MKPIELPHRFQEIFEPALLQEIQQVGKSVFVPAGTEMIHVGEPLNNIPIILSGAVKIMRVNEEGQELLLYYVDANQSCAMTFTCCMQSQPSEITAIAEEDTTLVMVPIQFMDNWLNRYPTWKAFVMRTIRERFNELLKTIDQVAFQKLDERLVSYLKEKARVHGSSALQVSHDQIAQDLGTSRVVVSRLLKRLELDKKLLLYRNEIKLLKAL
jgi:CRP/FNR family transcriptional regulator